MSRAASVCRELRWPGCHVIAKLIFIAFSLRSKRSRTKPTKFGPRKGVFHIRAA